MDDLTNEINRLRQEGIVEDIQKGIKKINKQLKHIKKKLKKQKKQK